MSEKEKKLHDAAEMILHDLCPPLRASYLCLVCPSEEPACELCWSAYLLAVANAPG